MKSSFYSLKGKRYWIRFACDILKELGYVSYPKPVVHLMNGGALKSSNKKTTL